MEDLDICALFGVCLRILYSVRMPSTLIRKLLGPDVSIGGNALDKRDLGSSGKGSRESKAENGITCNMSA
jgi:hypothetical protein